MVRDLIPPSLLNDCVPDCLFPSNNQLEIPALRLDVQPSFVEIPFLCYGEQRRSKDMHGQGVLHFYTDDYRWSAIYEHPEKILRHNPGAVVEPNYSLFNETPLAFGLQAIYKKRWLGRMMQERGIPVFVDLNVANKWYALNLFGVPKGYGSFCTRGYSDRLAALEYEYFLAERVAEGNLKHFVVYGGGMSVRDWCLSHNNTFYVTPIIAIKNKLKAIEQMKRNSVVYDSKVIEDDIHKLTIPTARKLYDEQIVTSKSELTCISNNTTEV